MTVRKRPVTVAADILHFPVTDPLQSFDDPLIWIALRFLQSHACKSPIVLRTVHEGAVSDRAQGEQP